jgi:hypothetical protein
VGPKSNRAKNSSNKAGRVSCLHDIRTKPVRRLVLRGHVTANPKTVRIDCVRITPGTAGEPLVLPLGSGNSAQVLVRACGRPAATTSGSAGDSWAGRCLFRQRRDQQSNYHQHRAADCSGGLQAFSLKKFGRRGRARSASVCEFRKKSATQARICRSASFYSEVINAFVFRDSDYEQHLLG